MTRGDLPPGVQCCQAVHAAFEFALAHPSPLRDRHGESSTLVILSTPDQLALAWLCRDAGLRHARFHEPDLGGVLTAAAFEPAAARRMLRHLPSALTRRGEVMTR